MSGFCMHTNHKLQEGITMLDTIVFTLNKQISLLSKAVITRKLLNSQYFVPPTFHTLS